MSAQDLLTVDQALARLLADARVRVGQESQALSAGLGRVLAADIHAAINVPPADNSAMDGYAIRYQDVRGADSVLPISQRIAAGHPPQALLANTAARIFTGAEIPPGADTVVMQEQCMADEAGVRILQLPGSGANIRPLGQDLRQGQQMLARGHRLRAQDMGLLASQGLDRVAFYRRLRVGVMSTGDELVDPGQPAGPGKIYNSNRYTLLGLLLGWGFEPVDLGIVPDDPQTIARVMRRAAQDTDALVCSGGVSVGEEDHVKAVVQSLGSIDLWRIAIRPGKPFAFGNVLGTPFLGLPGNPVSVFVTLLIIGRPYLLACQGIVEAAVEAQRRPALFDKPGIAREEYLRARITPDGLVLFPSQSSGMLLSTSWSDGLVRQRLKQDIKAGELVDFLPYSALL